MNFVKSDSIVRTIWGRRDTILFIFAGAAAEFALNKAADWLFFTGRLPADPIGRLFSTVTYARKIVFSSEAESLRVIDGMKAIHEQVELKRGYAIPPWAYRDVLFMLIYYSIASFEVLERTLTEEEKQEIYHVFYRVGARMGLTDLPQDYKHWLIAREQHLNADLEKTTFTDRLFKQYKIHLGNPRYLILKGAQSLVVPPQVIRLIDLPNRLWIRPAIFLYKICRKLKVDWFITKLLLPAAYTEPIYHLEILNKKTISGT